MNRTRFFQLLGLVAIAAVIAQYGLGLAFCFFVGSAWVMAKHGTDGIKW